MQSKPFAILFMKHEVIAQHISHQVAKSFLGTAQGLMTLLLLPGFMCSKSSTSPLSPVAKWRMGAELGKKKPEPSVVLRSFSMCFMLWGLFCFVLGNPHGTHATKWVDDPRLRDLDSWYILIPTSLMEHFSCPPTAWTRTWLLLLTQMKTYFVPSVEACFSFPFCLVCFFFSFRYISCPTPGCLSRTFLLSLGS